MICINRNQIECNLLVIKAMRVCISFMSSNKNALILQFALFLYISQIFNLLKVQLL